MLSIAVGFKHVLALDSEGKIYSWGRNDLGQVLYFLMKVFIIPLFLCWCLCLRVWLESGFELTLGVGVVGEVESDVIFMRS